MSLVLVCHEMARELPRTLLSLSPGHQRDAPPCEIIVVDNGSRDPPDPASFAHLGADLRFLRCDRSSPSPVHAVNQGLAAARGALIGVWIDAARLASPGLVRACAAAARCHARAVVATPNYQLGPQRQYLSVARGYDRGAEDALLSAIGWPEDGYRLFETATPEMRDPPYGPMLESNALFLPRALWDELGGYDPAFEAPGGGMVNPDTLIRACALPDTQLIRIRGEATFHQIHGGLSTSSTDLALRTLHDGSRFYHRLRGRPLAPVRRLGWVFDARTGALATDPR